MSNRRMGLFATIALAGSLASAMVLAATPALAQDGEKPADEEKSEASATAKVSTKDVKLHSTTDADSDHAALVGAFAVGLLGTGEIPFPTNAEATVENNIALMNATGSTVTAPVIGMRYWMSDLLGIDVGLGFLSQSGSINQHVGDLTNFVQGDVKNSKVSQLGFVLHGGVPLALHAEKHWVFLVVPEFNVGFSSGTQKPEEVYNDPNVAPPTKPNDIKLSGMLFDVGVRAGTELHFGFIGVPNLSLQAGVGLYMRYAKFKANGGGNPDPNASTPDTTYEETTMTIGTTAQDSPWAIFTKNVAALYYF